MKQKKFSFSLSKKSKWSLRVQYGNISEELTLTPPEPVAVLSPPKTEEIAQNPLFFSVLRGTRRSTPPLLHSS